MSALEELGLSAGDDAMDVELAAGVHLIGRRPEAPDWCRARVRVAELFDPVDKLAEARRRYALTGDDVGALADPAVWEGVAEYVIAVEVAALTVKRIERMDGDQLRSVEASAEVLAALFKRDENVVLFMRWCREADRGIAAPKKEPAPSPATCGPAGALTATAADA